MAPDKFISSHCDFLIGNADDYRGLIKEDIEKLKKILDICYQEKMPLVITMLSLPGSRWKQNNYNEDDLRDLERRKVSGSGCCLLARFSYSIKGSSCNLLNEPHPERIFASKEVHINTVHQEEVQKMLYNLYSRIIKHIRLVDKDTPIILDSSAYADAKTFGLLMPQEDQNVLYSFHMYEPYEYTKDMDSDIWLRVRAWALWKAKFELCQITDKRSHEAEAQKRIIGKVVNG